MFKDLKIYADIITGLTKDAKTKCYCERAQLKYNQKSLLFCFAGAGIPFQFCRFNRTVCAFG